MGVLLSVSTVLFLILCIFLIIIILLQSDKSAGMGILGGSSQSTFGSSTADVITKISAIMITLFMLGSLGLAMLESNKSISLDENISSEKADSSVIDKIADKAEDKKSNTNPEKNK